MQFVVQIQDNSLSQKGGVRFAAFPYDFFIYEV